MLCLGRRSGQTIRIGDDILITVVRISLNEVRIGIEAPRRMNIVRGELGTRPCEDSLEDRIENNGEVEKGNE